MDLFLDFIEIFRRLMIILAQNKVSVYFCDSCSSITNALLYKQHNNNNNKFKWLRVFSIAADWGHNKGNINVRIISKYIIHLEIVQKMYPTNVYVTRLTTIWNSSRNQVKINIGDSSGSYAHGQSCVKLLN